MELSEDEVIQKYGKQCGHRMRNTLLPYKLNGVALLVLIMFQNEKMNSL